LEGQIPSFSLLGALHHLFSKNQELPNKDLRTKTVEYSEEQSEFQIPHHPMLKKSMGDHSFPRTDARRRVVQEASGDTNRPNPP